MSARRDAQVELLRRVANRVFPIVPILGWVGFILIWLRWGREYKTDHDVGEYQREPFDDPPALVPTLFDWGGVPDVAVSATLVDLAQRGYMTIEGSEDARAFLTRSHGLELHAGRKADDGSAALRVDPHRPAVR